MACFMALLFANGITVLALAVVCLMAGRVVAEEKWDWLLWVAVLFVVLGIGTSLVLDNWSELRGEDPNSTTIRNMVLVLGGVIAGILALWRSIVAERQADTAQQSLLNERYQKGAEMLGSQTLSVRLGGIYALQRLAAEHPEQYHIEVMKLSCAFVRNPTKDDDASDKSYRREKSLAREDVQAVMEAIRDRRGAGIRLERSSEVKLVLDSAYLRGLDLRNADLIGASLIEANLSDALLDGADFSEAWLCGSNLTGTTLRATNLSGANLGSTLENYGRVDPACGLTQHQLDQACADQDKKPRLGGVDPVTCEPLEWDCKACEDK